MLVRLVRLVSRESVWLGKGLELIRMEFNGKDPHMFGFGLLWLESLVDCCLARSGYGNANRDVVKMFQFVSLIHIFFS